MMEYICPCERKETAFYVSEGVTLRNFAPTDESGAPLQGALHCLTCGDTIRAPSTDAELAAGLGTAVVAESEPVLTEAEASEDDSEE